VPTPQAVTQELASWVAAMTFERVPSDVVHQARRALLDYLGATLAGSTTGVSTTVRKYLEQYEGGSLSTVVGSDRRLSPTAAAMANGTSAHGLEIDDGHTRGSVHPAAACFPAVLAAAEAYGSSPEAVITASVVAYEVTCRLSSATHPATWRQGFHNTGVNGVFGAAAGVANLLGLDATRTAHALGIAGSFAGGLFEFLGTGAEVKRLHPGKAARDGLFAAEMASRGISGPTTVLEGRNGYFRAYAGGDVRVSAIFEGLGERWEIQSIYVKPYPCCRHLHGPIDAILAMAEQSPIPVQEIRSIRVETYGVASQHQHKTVKDFLDAQMSIPFAVAVALVEGKVGIDHFSASARSRADLQELMDKVEVSATADCETDYPRMRPARVILDLASGGKRSLRVDYPLGEPDNPLSDRELEQKFHNICDPVAGSEASRRIIQAVWRLSDMNELYATLRFPEGVLNPAAD